MGTLTGKHILVAGGTGDVGEGIVRSLLAQGATVTVPIRAPEKLERLRSGLGDSSRLRPVEGEVGSPGGALAIREKLVDPVDAVVASLGGWWQGTNLVDVDEATWSRVIADNLTSHYAVARAFLPDLEARGGTFLQILGGAADYPVPGSSLISITAAAVAMMGRVLEAESKARFKQLLINSFVATRSRARTDPSWVTSDEIGDLVVQMITGQAGADALKTVMEPHKISGTA